MDFGAYHGLEENNGLRIFRVTRARGLPRLHTHTHTHTHTHINTHHYDFELPTVTARFMINITVKGENPDFVTIFIPFHSLGYFWRTLNHFYDWRKIRLFTYRSFLTRPVCWTSHRCTWHSLSPVRCTKITGCIDCCWLGHGIVVYIEIFILSILKHCDSACWSMSSLILLWNESVMYA